MSTFLIIYIFVWTTFLEGALSAEFCHNWYYDKTYYCEYGCCNDGIYRGCCTVVGVIVGACLGGIALISFIVVIVCCCIKQKGKPGRIIGTTDTSSPAVVGANQYGAPMGYSGHTYGQPYPTGSAFPPPYQSQNPPGPPPGAGLYDDPAYPPSTAPPPYKR